MNKHFVTACLEATVNRCLNEAGQCWVLLQNGEMYYRVRKPSVWLLFFISSSHLSDHRSNIIGSDTCILVNKFGMNTLSSSYQTVKLVTILYDLCLSLSGSHGNTIV